MLAATEKDRDISWTGVRQSSGCPEPDWRERSTVTTASTDKPLLGEDRKTLREHIFKTSAPLE